jgi:hypothetical protein
MTPTELQSAIDLPPNWLADSTLQAELPSHLDYRHFRRIVESPDRYAVNILGTEPYVWDLKLQRPVPPMKDGSSGKRKSGKTRSGTSSKPRKRIRLRFRLNLGCFGGIKRFLLSRLVCAAVKGAPQRSTFQANHENGNPLDNHWRNLNWLTGEANRAIELVRPERMRTQKSGAANSNSKLSFAQLFRLIQTYDDHQTSESELATLFEISPAQVHRLVTGQSRNTEVNEIRWRLSAGAAHSGSAS